MRNNYEYKIAIMQSKIVGLEQDFGRKGDRGKKKVKGEERVRAMGEELGREKAEKQNTSMRVLQKEFDELQQDKEQNSQRQRKAEEEMQILQERCEKLERERRNYGAGYTDTKIMNQPRLDMKGLFTKLITAKDALVVIKEYKPKYEQAKTESRSVNGMSPCITLVIDHLLIIKFYSNVPAILCEGPHPPSTKTSHKSLPVVAICDNNFPPTSAQQGTDILEELSDHANKLSKVHAMPEVTKESRQIMAKSSFAACNAMKALMKL
ncbi:hypothetical protein PILCRDRAFT_91487 [Piloderma croceum F 1598]|uniref:Uncharacterized protein n=1 Tax=Piloderma croceum (strain F 1598) TaxID=765440 RepID=A0A0C3FAE0_PILCF|nr:hypothetical protein PILCRDRAFT_91487 [Piloderma croceum F 1598]